MMNKITFFFLLFSFLSLSTLQAQQDAQYTHYTNNMNVLNPAYAGSKGTLSIGLLGRTQWVALTMLLKPLPWQFTHPLESGWG